jgi:hypothetical protein
MAFTSSIKSALPSGMPNVSSTATERNLTGMQETSDTIPERDNVPSAKLASKSTPFAKSWAHMVAGA